jgi:hypothetical protein
MPTKPQDTMPTRPQSGSVNFSAANPSGQTFVLAIGAEPINSPWSLVLVRQEQAVLLQSDGLSPIKQRTL